MLRRDAGPGLDGEYRMSAATADRQLEACVSCAQDHRRVVIGGTLAAPMLVSSS
jgi:hypothetical protein